MVPFAWGWLKCPNCETSLKFTGVWKWLVLVPACILAFGFYTVALDPYLRYVLMSIIAYASNILAFYLSDVAIDYGGII